MPALFTDSKGILLADTNKNFGITRQTANVRYVSTRCLFARRPSRVPQPTCMPFVLNVDLWRRVRGTCLAKVETHFVPAHIHLMAGDRYFLRHQLHPGSSTARV